MNKYNWRQLIKTKGTSAVTLTAPGLFILS